MKKETRAELFELLYDLEIEFEYDNTKTGKRVGELINKLNKEII
tara:strand:+ start:38 stop:169 length:132 start_codon:yes stop_codon:yes gene_type:complete